LRRTRIPNPVRITVLAVLLAIAPRQIAACSCGDYDPRVELRSSDLVFRGNVTEARELPDAHMGNLVIHRYQATFAVTGYWKGDAGRTVSLYSVILGDVGCGTGWTTRDTGKEYVVFAQWVTAGEEFAGIVENGARVLFPGACTGFEVNGMSRHLKRLGKSRPPK
jgi:hypothetical protein